MCQSKAEAGRRCQPKKGHGSSAAAVGVGGSSPSGPRRSRRSRAAVLKAAQKQLDDLLDAAVDAAPVDSAAVLGAVAAADVADQIADAITTTLGSHGCPRGSWQDHLLCGALAAAASAMQAAEDQGRSCREQGRRGGPGRVRGASPGRGSGWPGRCGCTEEAGSGPAFRGCPPRCADAGRGHVSEGGRSSRGGAVLPAAARVSDAVVCDTAGAGGVTAN